MKKTILTIIVLVVVGVIGYFVWVSTSNNSALENDTYLNKNTLISAPQGFSSFSNNAFSIFYPQSWTKHEYKVSTSPSSCNAEGVDFVSDVVSQKVLTEADTDNFHYLDRKGGIISARGGLGEVRQSFSKYREYLNSPDLDRNFGFTFMIQKQKYGITVNILKKDINLESVEPSVTYYYEIPEKNKRGITQYKVVDGKPSAVLMRIDYLVSTGDYSEDIFKTIQLSFKNLTNPKSCK